MCLLLIIVTQRINKLRKLAEQSGKKFEVKKLRRNLQMDEYDLLHWKRSLEEREALIRDISWYSCCLSLVQLGNSLKVL